MNLRRLEDKDLNIVYAWLLKPRIKHWFHPTEEWVSELELGSTKFSFITHFIVEEKGKPIGFCQYYYFPLGGETWNGSIPAKDCYSIDYLIGDDDYIGKGYSRRIVTELINHIRDNTDARYVIAQPEEDNTVSKKTLLSAGFEKKDDIFVFTLDPFYSISNMAHLRRGVAALNAGMGTPHDLIEENDNKKD